MAAALTALSQRLLKLACGGADSVTDSELIAWGRGDNIRSNVLKSMGLFEPARDDNAFRRLKTVIAFLRSRMGYQGFLIAFDEGTRTSSFRRGSAKQRQAIENLLTMINQNAEGEFGGVMFLYAATPDFRSDVISTYRALQDRIGSTAFSKGSPLVPLINIEETNSRGDHPQYWREASGCFQSSIRGELGSPDANRQHTGDRFSPEEASVRNTKASFFRVSVLPFFRSAEGEAISHNRRPGE